MRSSQPRLLRQKAVCQLRRHGCGWPSNQGKTDKQFVYNYDPCFPVRLVLLTIYDLRRIQRMTSARG